MHPCDNDPKSRSADDPTPESTSDGAGTSVARRVAILTKPAISAVVVPVPSAAAWERTVAMYRCAFAFLRSLKERDETAN